MKFPYGISDFKVVNTEGYYYCDRTEKIHVLENSKSQLFIRPRRFGKSLLLSMLENYYDVAKKDDFGKIFGNLKIGENPTKRHNSYFILKWDFSCVDPTGSTESIKYALFNHLNARIETFCKYYKYKGYTLPKIKINYNDALYTIESLLSAVQTMSYPIYLLIDEYDNFANTILMGIKNSKERYDALVHNEGPLRTLFKMVKASTSGTMFDRVFITGVSPVVLSDITSGYNIAKDICFEPEFNDICGFKKKEMEALLEKIAGECNLNKMKVDEALDLMLAYYDGYKFNIEADESIYNPTLCLYFLEQFEKSCNFPREMLDDNLAADESKLEYIAQIPQGRFLLMTLMEKDRQVSVQKISKRFGIKEMLTDSSKDNTFLSSFLYYFGVLTIVGETDDLKIILKVPNLVMQSLYIERIQKMLLPQPTDRDNGKQAAEEVYRKGNLKPLCKFMEDHYFKVFNNRDYQWANELTVKTAFLTLLYNDILYIMDSEPEISRRYADLTMILRPDKRHAKVFDILIEFKFLKLTDANINREEALSLNGNELSNIPIIKKHVEAGKEQVRMYAESLKAKYKSLRLKTFIVIALGFERIYFQEMR